MAYAEDLKSILPIPQHSAPLLSMAKIASVHGLSKASFRAASRSKTNKTEKATDTTTDT